MDRLRATGKFSEVKIYDGRLDVDFVLSGGLEKLEEVDYEGGAGVEVAHSVQMTDLRSGKTVWTEVSSENAPVDKRAVAAVVAEMSQAMDRAIQKLLASLTGPTLVGTSVGSLIELLGGPVGFAIGATAGLFAGSMADLNNATVDEDFIDDVRQELKPNKYAVVAGIQEDWTTPVDSRMEGIGGKVYRRVLSEVKQTIHDEDIAATKADLAQMKTEQAKAHADRKAKLQEKINQLDSKIQAQLEKAKQQREAADRHANAKVERKKYLSDPMAR